MASKGMGKQKPPASAAAAAAAAAAASAKGKRSTNRSSGSAAEASNSRKKRRSGVHQFVDDAAFEVGSDDDEDDDAFWTDLEDELPDLDIGGVDVTSHSQKLKGGKGSGNARTLPFVIKEEELSGDELEEFIRQRYSQGSKHVLYEEDIKISSDKMSDIHSVNDPRIWKVKCVVGHERKIAFSLMQKYVDVQQFGSKLPIISVVVPEHTKGHVYIEAEREFDVGEACKGFCNIYFSRMGRVPLNEIPHLFSPRSKSWAVSEGAWARVSSGNYKGDLAKVMAVDNKNARAMIKLVPRVDLKALAMKFGGGLSRQRASVPSPHKINLHELEEFRPHIQRKFNRQTKEVCDVLDGLMLKDGYLYKTVSFRSLIFSGVQPKDSELQIFDDSNVDETEEDLGCISSEDIPKQKSTDGKSCQNEEGEEQSAYKIHDLVLFRKKDFGVIISMDKDSLQVLKGASEGPSVVTITIYEIKNVCVDKMFKACDHSMKTVSIGDVIRVLEGPFQGRRGIVKHMYRGHLFIYDETQTEHSGIFSVMSQSCQSVKFKDSFGKKGSDKASSSFSQNPVESFHQDDNSNGFDRRRHNDSPFSIGQTLRIRKGPMKGYLCRVVGIYRSDIKVKLDSMLKVVTVPEELLSVPTVSRNDTADMSYNNLETQELQPLGSFGDMAVASAGGSSWDAEFPLTNRELLQVFSASGIPSADEGGRKADQLEGDPWGSSKAKSSKIDSWGNPGESSSQVAWDKSTSEKESNDNVNCQSDQWKTDADCAGTTGRSAIVEADSWGKTAASVDNAGWGSGAPKSGSRSSADGWNNTEKEKSMDSKQEGSWARKKEPVDATADAWNAKEKSNMVDECRSWGNASEPAEKEHESSWTRNKEPVDPRADAWKAKEKSYAGNAARNWGNASESADKLVDISQSGEKKTNSWENSGNNHDNETTAWDTKCADGLNSKEVTRGTEIKSWGNDAKSSEMVVSNKECIWDQAKLPSSNWGSKVEGSTDQTQNWGSKAGNDNSMRGWNDTKSLDGEQMITSSRKPSISVGSDPDNSWNKPKPSDTSFGLKWDDSKVSSNPSSPKWAKPKDVNEGGAHNWNRGACADKANDGGSREHGKPTISSCNTGGNWGKANDGDSSKCDNWTNKANNNDSGGWNRTGTSIQGQAEQWNKPMISCGSIGGSWDKANDGGSSKLDKPTISMGSTGGSWDKARDGGSSKCDNWTKADNTDVAVWNKTEPSSQGQTGQWDKPRSNNSDPTTAWNRAAGNDAGNGNSGKCDNWNNTNNAGGGGWNKSGPSSQGQTDQWDKQNSFSNSRAAAWSKPEENDAGTDNQNASWGSSRNFDGGRGFNRGRGRGRNGGDRGFDWGRGRGGRDGGDDRGTCGRGFWQGRGGGGRGENSGDGERRYDGDEGFNHGRGGGRGFGRGRGGGGRGENSGDGEKRYDGDEGFNHGRGSGRGFGRGRGRSWNGSGERGNDSGSFGRGRGRNGGWNSSSDWKSETQGHGCWNKEGETKPSWATNQVSIPSTDWSTPSKNQSGSSRGGQWDGNKSSGTEGTPLGWNKECESNKSSWATNPVSNPSTDWSTPSKNQSESSRGGQWDGNKSSGSKGTHSGWNKEGEPNKSSWATNPVSNPSTDWSTPKNQSGSSSRGQWDGNKSSGTEGTPLGWNKEGGSNKSSWATNSVSNHSTDWSTPSKNQSGSSQGGQWDGNKSSGTAGEANKSSWATNPVSNASTDWSKPSENQSGSTGGQNKEGETNKPQGGPARDNQPGGWCRADDAKEKKSGW